MTFENTFEKGPEYLKKKTGKPTGMNFIINISGGKNHTLFGELIEDNNQLFPQYQPEIATGSYIQIRQDTKDANTIDVEIHTPDGKKKLIKPAKIHHQPENNTPYYYTSFDYAGCKVKISIGSDIPIAEFYKKTEKSIMSDWFPKP